MLMGQALRIKIYQRHLKPLDVITVEAAFLIQFLEVPHDKSNLF